MDWTTACSAATIDSQAKSHRWWDGVRPGLARHFRTITFNYRGTGDTEADDTDAAAWTTRLFAAAAAPDALGRPSAVLGEIRTQTLVLHGSEDRMAPARNAEPIAEAVPDAAVEIFPRGRHGFSDEFPAVGDRVTEFLLRGR
ncbi:alpha/beta hydrolase [Nocardia sp. NPDC050193]